MPVFDGAAAAAVVARTLQEAADAHRRAATQDPVPIVAAARAIREAVAAGKKVLAFGNGGSAADAQHLTAELVGRFQKDRGGFAAVALTADTSLLTSLANDFGFERVFARQIEALGVAGDVAVALSTSGRSPNIVAALHAARDRGLRTIALTGRDGGRLAEMHINVPEATTARIQEVHITLIHALCELVEL
jgi:D-sedoheptulose 7-phosphate isomerase